MRVLILTHHYPPEVGAPQTRLSGTARFLKSRGHDVDVVTSMPSYPTGVVLPEFRGRLFDRGAWDGVPVIRTPTIARPGGSISVRLLNQLSFAATGLLAIPSVRQPDVILAESPPLFVGASAAVFGAARRAPIVLHVSDLWPRFPIEMGALRNPTLIRWAKLFERAVYRRSRRVIVVTRGWVDHLRRQGVPENKIRVITNGVDTDLFDPDRPRLSRDRLRSVLGLGESTVVACIGTLSMAYDYDLILDAAERLRDAVAVKLLIVGGGSLESEVEASIERRHLTNVVRLGAQPLDRVPQLLAASDLALVALRNLPVTRGQLPVRILEAMAMRLPVILAGAGESLELVVRARCGISTEPTELPGVVSAIERLAGDPGIRRTMGEGGRSTIISEFSRSTVAERIEGVLAETAMSHRAARPSTSSA